MTNHPNRGRVEIRNSKSHSRAAKFVARGYRYNVDGWTQEIDLFVFYADHAQHALEDAKELRVTGSNGLARHGCEDITSFRDA